MYRNANVGMGVKFSSYCLLQVHFSLSMKCATVFCDVISEDLGSCTSARNSERKLRPNRVDLPETQSVLKAACLWRSLYVRAEYDVYVRAEYDVWAGYDFYVLVEYDVGAEYDVWAEYDVRTGWIWRLGWIWLWAFTFTFTYGLNLIYVLGWIWWMGWIWHMGWIWRRLMT